MVMWCPPIYHPTVLKQGSVRQAFAMTFETRIVRQELKPRYNMSAIMTTRTFEVNVRQVFILQIKNKKCPTDTKGLSIMKHICPVVEALHLPLSKLSAKLPPNTMENRNVRQVQHFWNNICPTTTISPSVWYKEITDRYSPNTSKTNDVRQFITQQF